MIARQLRWLENTTQYYRLFLEPWVYDTNVSAVCPFRPSVSQQLEVQLETLKGICQMQEIGSTVRSFNELFMITVTIQISPSSAQRGLAVAS